MKYRYNSVELNYELMKKCLLANGEGQRFFHYTSQESFYAMFKDYVEQQDLAPFSETKLKYINLFASQMQYLNDKQEYKEGLQIINLERVDTTNLVESIFVTCFCGKEDLLSQWKYYGKNCGISIEFDFSDTQLCWYSLIKKEENKEMMPSINYWANITPYKVFYNKHAEQFSNIREFVRNSPFKDMNDREAANIFIPYCKNAHFAEEDESRLVFYPIESLINDNNYLITKIEYRVSNGKIIPQFKCKIAYADEKKAKRSIPVKSIMIGPGNNQRLVFNSIITMLERDKSRVKFYNDEELENILSDRIQLTNDNFFGLNNDRITYKTTDNILISMSRIPFRD